MRGLKLHTPMARTRPSFKEVLQRPVGLDGRVEVLGQRLVQEVEVDRVDPQLARAHVERMERRVHHTEARLRGVGKRCATVDRQRNGQSDALAEHKLSDPMRE